MATNGTDKKLIRELTTLLSPKLETNDLSHILYALAEYLGTTIATLVVQFLIAQLRAKLQKDLTP